MIQKYILFSIILGILPIMMCKDSGWDYYNELTTGFNIPDQGILGFGTTINPDPTDAKVARRSGDGA
jgi:hypothetical protein